MFYRFKAILVAGLALAAAALTAPTQGHAAPISAGWNTAGAAGAAAGEALFSTVGWRERGHYRRVHYRRAHFYRPRHYRVVRYYRPVRHYRPVRYYRPVRHYRPVRFYRPVRHYRPAYYRPVHFRPYRPVRCRIVYRAVWNGWGYVHAPVRVCRRW